MKKKFFIMFLLALMVNILPNLVVFAQWDAQIAYDYDEIVPLSKRGNCVATAREIVPSLPSGLDDYKGKKSIINTSVPVAGAIAIGKGYHNSVALGHVSYVESVNGDGTITTIDGGYASDPTHCCRITSTPEEMGITGYWYDSNAGKTTKPVVKITGKNVTLEWEYSRNATSFDAYLLQSPWGWEDIKYAALNNSSSARNCTFTNVADSEYSAFVIARPNPDTAQSEWAEVKVVNNGLALNYFGDDVKKLQETLNGITGTKLGTDGFYGANTAKAVKEYQEKKGFTADGWYGASTKAALEEEVKTLQNMLNAVNGTALTADGHYGANTAKAVKEYQEKKGLTADGWYGGITKAALEEDYNNLTSTPSPTPATTNEPSKSDEPAAGGGTTAITTPDSFHFAKKTRYTQGQFTDVPDSQWYTDGVASAFETGLMVGKSDTTFSPFSDVTIAEAVTMAARVHCIYSTGTENFVSSDTWYQPYLDYAYQNGIISKDYYNCDVNQKANRAQFAEIFANSLPGEALQVINGIADNAIPDVEISSPYASCVYKLYRAGILAGGDARGTFSPDTYITRAEATSIVSRLGDTDLRVSFSLN